MWPRFEDRGADGGEVAVELAVVAGPQFDVDHVRTIGDLTGQPEERLQASPRRMGVVHREPVVPRLHPEVHQRHFHDGHNLILAVVEFVHRPLARRQVLQFA